MPSFLSREDALNQIRKIIHGDECLVCALLEKKTGILIEAKKHCSVFLSQYPRTWGQTMIVLNRHEEKMDSITRGEWMEMQDAAYTYAQKIEKKLNPLRINITLMGSTQNRPNTCPHLHLNLLPVYETDQHPKNLYTWENGLLTASDEEWNILIARLKPKFRKSIFAILETAGTGNQIISWGYSEMINFSE